MVSEHTVTITYLYIIGLGVLAALGVVCKCRGVMSDWVNREAAEVE